MQQAQKMQEKLQQAQENVKTIEVVGESGAGLVKVTMTGKHDVRRVEIDTSLMQEDKEVLEDLVAAAINAAVKNVEHETQGMMGGVTSGINLPEGFKLPF